MCVALRMSELFASFMAGSERERWSVCERPFSDRIFRQRSEFCAMCKFCMSKVYAALLNAVDILHIGKFANYLHLYSNNMLEVYMCVISARAC